MPLHGLHKIPIDPALPISTQYLYLAAKYANKAFALFDKKYQGKIKVVNAFEELVESLKNITSD